MFKICQKMVFILFKYKFFTKNGNISTGIGIYFKKKSDEKLMWQDEFFNLKFSNCKITNI